VAPARLCDDSPVESGTAGMLGALVAAGLAVVWLGAALARARRAHRRALEERGWLLERERESAAGSAVEAERAVSRALESPMTGRRAV